MNKHDAPRDKITDNKDRQLMSTTTTPSPNVVVPPSPKKWGWVMAVGVSILAVAIIALAARIYMVNLGVLYGSASVARVDGIAASLFGGGAAVVATAWSRRARSQQTTNDTAKTFADRAATLTALASLVALCVSTVNLFVPVELPSRAKLACPGVQDRTAPYIGITSGPQGDNSRNGPSRTFDPDGRFPADCSIGFSGYCLGDPIQDSSGTIDGVQNWMTSRWLIVTKQPPGWRTTMAHILSGENSEPQYITDANVTPETNFAQLTLAPASQCPSGTAYPGKATLSPLNTSTDTFTAQANHAVNMGFAVWIPPSSPFIDPDSYYPMFNPNTNAANNPGATDARGNKTVAWAYHRQLLDNLDPGAPTAQRPAIVVVMAIPCLSDNIPAATHTAALAAYAIGSAAEPVKANSIPAGLDPQRLARAACQANT
jgi:hypothetical protein